MVIFFKIPYISERLNHRITNIFRKETIPLRIAHKSYTLRKALFHTSTERKCTISNTELCLRRNEAYQLTCSRWNHWTIYWWHYTLHHDRVREHINNENSSVKKEHIYSCQNEDYKGIEVKIIMSENDPTNVRLYEAFYITNCLSPHSIPEKNVLNLLQTFYFNILF